MRTVEQIAKQAIKEWKSWVHDQLEGTHGFTEAEQEIAALEEELALALATKPTQAEAPSEREALPATAYWAEQWGESINEMDPGTGSQRVRYSFMAERFGYMLDAYRAALATLQADGKGEDLDKAGHLRVTIDCVNEGTQWTAWSNWSQRIVVGQVSAADALRLALVDAGQQAEQGEAVGYMRPDELQKAKKAPHLCRVHPEKDKHPDMVPIYITQPPPQQPEALAQQAVQGEAVAQGWTPTPENINALPAPVRSYIHELVANADPAGTVRDLTIARDTVRALESSNRALRDLDTPGNRHPEFRFAGYSGEPLPAQYTSDQHAAYDEGVRARIATPPAPGQVKRDREPRLLTPAQVDAIWNAREAAPQLQYRYLVTRAIEEHYGIRAARSSEGGSQ